MSVQYSSHPYQKFPSDYQSSYSVQKRYSITTQPVNTPRISTSMLCTKYPSSISQYLPESITCVSATIFQNEAGWSFFYGTSLMDVSALVSKPYPMMPGANVHKSNPSSMLKVTI
ncbi:hypothetical protein CEXT_580411 [Caerostris extrusa]|uniref:Uncharacterized protein n=1 Tax=Caerostris extrusa TaxID=172846 RepID=A0AAV4R6A3_CAEEX|nr:hypothetical protein CEXT_580411 [Caerostris extrusa]